MSWKDITVRFIHVVSEQEDENGKLFICCNICGFKYKQGQSNQCRTPGVKFEKLTKRKWGKQDETGRNG